MKAAVWTSQSMDDRIQQIQKILEQEPDFLPAINVAGRAVTNVAGIHEKSLEYMERDTIPCADGTRSPRLWKTVTKNQVSKGAGQREADALIAKSKQTYISPTSIARAFAMAEQPDEALDWLERAYQIRDSYLTVLQEPASFPYLRADPRFDDFMQRLDFPK